MIEGDPRGIWYDIETDEDTAAELTERSRLMIEVMDRVQGLTKAEAAQAIGVSQRRVTDLLAGKLSQFSLDELRAMSTALE